MRIWIAVSIAIGLGLVACTAAQAVLLGEIFAVLLHPSAGIRGIVSKLVGLGAVTLVRSLLLALSAPAGAVAANRVRGQLRRDGLAAVLDHGPAWLADERVGELAVTLGKGLDSLDTYIGDYLPRLVLAVLAPMFLLGVIADLDWLSLIVVLAALALVPLFMVLIGRLTEERVAQRWLALTTLGAHFLDAIEGLATLRAYGRARLQEQQIGKVTEEVRRTTLSVLREAFLSALVLETLATIGTALVAVPLALRLIDGQVGLAPALSVLVLTPEVFLPIRRASSDFHASIEGLSATDRVMEILETERDSNPVQVIGEESTSKDSTASSIELLSESSILSVSSSTGYEQASNPSAPLSLHGVSVRYGRQAGMVLDSIDLELLPGERLAVVGPSGAGKSTLLTTVLGLTPYSAGSIALGKVFQAEADAEWWRAQFAYVPQAPRLFAGTLMYNLFLGHPELPSSDEYLHGVLEAACLSSLIAGLPDGLATEVGEGGERLSAGERQRVAIARALLRTGAGVVVLDEPTAHLDVATEAELAAHLDVTIEGRTLLLVTHRRRMLELVDRVVVLKGGRISEDTSNDTRRPRLSPSTDGSVPGRLLAGSEMPQ